MTRNRSRLAYGVALTMAIFGCDRPRAVLPDSSVEIEDGGTQGVHVNRLVPERGPHEGGTVVTVEGAGFDSSVRVRVAGVEIPRTGVRVLAPGRLTVVMPAHAPGVVSLVIARGDQSAAAEYRYEALTVEPALAPMTGGARVEIRGAGTDFALGDEFLFGDVACSELVVESPTSARCRVPSASAVGRVDVAQRRSGERLHEALDAFAYVSEPFVFGGVGGGRAAGSVRVTATGWVGPIADADVALVPATGETRFARTDADGLASFDVEPHAVPFAVHVGHACYGRTSIVGASARELVVPLVPHRTGGDCPAPPANGATGTAPGVIEGVLVFYSGQEFRTPTRSWFGVPEPRVGERRVAYVGTGDVRPEPVDGAHWVEPVTEAEWQPERTGYEFHVAAAARAQRVCASAGLESTDIGRPSFRPFLAGCSDSVSVPPYGEATDAIIPMEVLTTASLEIDIAPLARRDTETAISPTEVATVSSVVSGLVQATSWFRRPLDSSWRFEGLIAPAVVRVQRVPDESSWWAASPLEAVVLWGDDARFATSRARLRVDSLAGRLRAVPLEIPSFTSPTAGSVLAPGDSTAAEIIGDVTLVQQRVVPVDYVFGGSVAPWYTLARGDMRQLPGLPDDERAPTLRLDDGTYMITWTVQDRPTLDFDSWSLLTLESTHPWRRTATNTVFARVAR